ncbi:iron repressor protein [mine drainage metagenome]|uniref:Iron repressor protein n=1 Tax=mine drainage metagenome TaxID=410659 RepID=T0ZZI8_9ZZZZ
MEPLQQLTRRQIDALDAVRRGETPGGGASLTAVARLLRVRPPSALDHLTQLESLRLVDRYRGKSRLTTRGTQTLAEYRRHHRIAEGMFGRLGLSPDDTCRAAREIDLALSHRTIERLCVAEGHPSTCPHGAPIPKCASSTRAP